MILFVVQTILANLWTMVLVLMATPRRMVLDELMVETSSGYGHKPSADEFIFLRFMGREIESHKHITFEGDRN